MKFLSLFAVGTCVLVFNTALAADPPDGAKPLTRAEVKKSVLDARASGELSSGEVPNYPYIRPQSGGKKFKRKPKAVPADSTPASEPSVKK